MGSRLYMEAVQFMQLTQASVWLFMTSQSHMWTLIV